MIRMRQGPIGFFSAVFFCIGLSLSVPGLADAHCDTLDGPVVMDARKALDRGDLTLVLKWVKAEHEEALRSAFQSTLAVRDKGPEAKALADKYFFETLVRLHREGEGAPYTGLKPAGTDPGLAVRKADEALETGSADKLSELLTEAVNDGVRKRFAHALEKKRHAADSVGAGREFVKAYVEFIHYAERVHLHATSKAVHHPGPEGDAH